MIVSCPECNKRYQIEATLIPSQGRQVRCAACGHVWLQQGDVVEQISQNPRIQNLKNVTAKSASKGSIIKPLLGWGSFGIFTLALLGIILLDQGTVKSYFPQSKKIYSLIGFPPTLPGEGLAIINTQVMKTSEGSFIVKGNVQNVSDKVRELSALKIKALGPDSCENPDENNNCIMKQWQLTFDHQSLLPGEQLQFESLPYPLIKGTQSVGVSF